jgi:hypothetical protein
MSCDELRARMTATFLTWCYQALTWENNRLADAVLADFATEWAILDIQSDRPYHVHRQLVNDLFCWQNSVRIRN